MEQNKKLKWEIVQRLPVENRNNFSEAIFLSVVKPHLINRRLAGAEHLCVFRSNDTTVNIDGKLINQFSAYIEKHIDNEIDVDFVKDALDESSALDKFEEMNVQKLTKYDLKKKTETLIILNKLLPKNVSTYKCTFELNIIDIARNQVGYLNLLQNQTNGFIKRFIVELQQHENCRHEVVFMAQNDCGENFTRQINWMKKVFIPKVTKWIVLFKNEHNARQKSAIDCVESLSLISLSEYNQLYNDLKAKYGEHMVKIWPECTDPLKFVYEDVAIASYLILLWRNERRRMNSNCLQSFVDLGCGNGLLVYILSSEGHRGYGIDVRKRGIWDIYPETTVLKTLAIVPSDRSLFPDVDWIIGNHSDELSPWIPVISARSSYASRYFLLPCCAFEFSGKKFQRRNGVLSQYMDFLNYAQEISNVCGFKTQIDRLKIPSTKRICLIGCERTYASDEQNIRENLIQDFINISTKSSDSTIYKVPNSNETNWNNDFQPRSDIEKIQNCSKVDKSIQNYIVHRVFNELIKKRRLLTDYLKPNWNIGGKISLVDLARIIHKEKLQALKSECGGLQTLLKNHSHIFRVCQGIVELKLPVKWSVKKLELKARGIEIQPKQKPCWFHLHHPDGCLLTDQDCSFNHSMQNA